MSGKRKLYLSIICVVVLTLIGAMRISNFLTKILSKNMDKPAHEMVAGKKYDVHIPKEEFSVGTVERDRKGYVYMLNSNILNLNHKEVFPWFLSLAIHIENPNSDGMPEGEELIEMQDFCDRLDRIIKIDNTHPNAILLGRVTGDGWIQIMWYVYKPDKTHADLQQIIETGDHEFHFDYQITKDQDWKEAHYWLDPLIEATRDAESLKSRKFCPTR